MGTDNTKNPPLRDTLEGAATDAGRNRSAVPRGQFTSEATDEGVTKGEQAVDPRELRPGVPWC